ncbi:MAG TPA: hypothetical protein VJ201_05645, partial [Candidatus Babeliales bacterium]|nr:hypothetical protein [Candidatus Babeliales bacterium]
REPRDKQPHHVLEGFACSGCGNKFVSDALEDGFTMTCATVPPGLPNKYLPPQVRGLWVDDSILRKLFLSGVRIYLDDSKLIKNETHVQRIFTIARESHCQNCVVLPDKYVQKQLLKQIASGSDLGFMSDIINVNEDPNGSTEFFEHNIDRLKELIREIIESNLPGQITDQAIQLLEVMDSGTKSVNPKYALDLVGNIIGCGGIPYILCRLSFIGTGAAIANVPGAYEGFVLGQPVCLLVLGTGTAAGIAKTGLENAYFRDGEDSGTGKAQKGGAMEPASKSTNNQIKKYQDQLETDGIESIKKSKSSLESNLNVHKQKLDIIKSEGGYTSSVEKEIRNFEGEIKAIERVLEKIGGKP